MGIDAAQHFHQGRLARAVFADERVDLAGLDLEIDVAQRLHAGKALADAAHLEHCRHRLVSRRTAAPAGALIAPAGVERLIRIATSCSSRSRSEPSPSCSCTPRRA